MSDTISQSVDILSQLPVFYYPFIAVIGLLVGSFLNVVILRTPKILENEFRSECCDLLKGDLPEADSLEKKVPTPVRLSLAWPPSSCPACQAVIKPWHNIPVISYLLLGGKCHRCSNTINIRYPVIELATSLLSLLTIYWLGFTVEGLLSLLLLWFLIALTMIDVDTCLLPDTLTLPLLWLGLLINSFGIFTDLSSAVWGAIAGYLILWSVFWVFKLITGKQGMGYGDFKLLAALGAWMGWQLLPVIIMLSSLVGALTGIAGIIILGRDKNIPIPFGPYLAIAGWIALLWGGALTSQYFQLFL